MTQLAHDEFEVFGRVKASALKGEPVGIVTEIVNDKTLSVLFEGKSAPVRKSITKSGIVKVAGRKPAELVEAAEEFVGMTYAKFMAKQGKEKPAAKAKAKPSAPTTKGKRAKPAEVETETKAVPAKRAKRAKVETETKAVPAKRAKVETETKAAPDKRGRKSKAEAAPKAEASKPSRKRDVTRRPRRA